MNSNLWSLKLREIFPFMDYLQIQAMHACQKEETQVCLGQITQTMDQNPIQEDLLMNKEVKK